MFRNSMILIHEFDTTLLGYTKVDSYRAKHYVVVGIEVPKLTLSEASERDTKNTKRSEDCMNMAS